VNASGPDEQAALATTRGRRASGNRRMAWAGAALALTMIGLTYAATPFYAAFCRATGYGGTTQKAATGASFEGRRTLRVAFDANVAPGLNWRLEPETDAIEVRTGHTVTVYFRVRNLSDRPGAANAVYNVTPEVSGGWFDKISCFCFTEQHLGPRQTAEWPVVFFLDPNLESDPSMDKVDSITLSYTLFAAPAGPDRNAAAGPAG
jgi:cytochrome c oxidase assembly protein subunit 11